MDQADAVPTTNPSIELTRKGERAAIDGAPDRMTAVAEKRRLYTVAAREVERMLAFLDRLDGDPDLELDEDGEPSLSAMVGFDPTGGDDRELDQSDDEPDADGEPSLGFTSCGAGVRPWDAGDDDREADDSESEASLGSPESVNTYSGPSYDGWAPEGVRRNREGRQTHWAKGNSSDLEGDAHEDHEEGGDMEPSLGWVNVQPGRRMSQGDNIWSRYQTPVIDEGMDQDGIASGPGDTNDLEDAHDGREPDVDDEDGHDAEYCTADELGVADFDAMNAEDMIFSATGDWDGSGQRIARRLLNELEERRDE
jgi:hypothetical protein